jgi:hypothetical protein
MGCANPFYIFTFQEFFNGIRKFSIQLVLALEITLSEDLGVH